MLINVVNGKDQVIDIIDTGVNNDYTLNDYIEECYLNGKFSDLTRKEFIDEIQVYAFEDPEDNIILDWVTNGEIKDFVEKWFKEED